MPFQALGAEIVVVFEGTSEFGHQFSTRQSYLPREIHWGYQFVQIVHPADPGSTQHIVDISRWALESDIVFRPTACHQSASGAEVDSKLPWPTFLLSVVRQHTSHSGSSSSSCVHNSHTAAYRLCVFCRRDFCTSTCRTALPLSTCSYV